jgi:endonuclease YncB( thermonuclease family)
VLSVSSSEKDDGSDEGVAGHSAWTLVRQTIAANSLLLVATRMPIAGRASPIVQQLLKSLLIAVAVSATCLAQGRTRSSAVLVRYAVDGDTIDVAVLGRVRLLGIDAPEIGRGFDTSEPFAGAARERLASLVTARWVRLESERDMRRDTYDRHLAYVFLETGTFINELLVREGLARVMARATLTRLGELQRAEAAAKSSRRGMWGAVPPIPTERLVLPLPSRKDRRR